jgi:hypothetical protein
MKLKPLAAPMAALAALTMIGTMPAAAQPAPQSWNGASGWDRNAFWRGAPDDIYARMDFLRRRIDRGIAEGSIDRREARKSLYELDRLRRGANNMRYRHRGRLTPDDINFIQGRLDQLSQQIRWQRRNGAYGYGQGPGGYGQGPGGYGQGRDADWERRYATDYDARRYYREGPNYQERRLSSSDEVYRGSDGRYYCKRSDGTTGLVVGAAAGGILGNVIDGGHNRVAGTLIGGALGALAGRSIDQNSDIRCR